LNHILGPNHVKYQDIISEPDIEFWRYLCNKDFKRLQKLLNQALGEGVFFDDTDSDESEDNHGSKMHGTDSEEDEDHRLDGTNRLGNRRGRVNDGNRNEGYDEEEDFDHDGFMEQMLAEMHSAQEEELNKQGQSKKQQEEEKERLEYEQSMKDSKFHENQFWKVNEGYDLEDLLADYEN
jgi:hypothetical protein